MTGFTKTCLVLAVLGCVLTPISFQMGTYVDLDKAMLQDKPFDEKPAASFDDATNRFGALSANAKQLYKSHVLRDIPFFISMGVAIAALLMLAWGTGHSKWVYVGNVVTTLRGVNAGRSLVSDNDRIA